MKTALCAVALSSIASHLWADCINSVVSFGRPYDINRTEDGFSFVVLVANVGDFPIAGLQAAVKVSDPDRPIPISTGHVWLEEISGGLMPGENITVRAFGDLTPRGVELIASPSDLTFEFNVEGLLDVESLPIVDRQIPEWGFEPSEIATQFQFDNCEPANTHTIENTWK